MGDIKRILSYYFSNCYHLVTASKDNSLEIGRRLVSARVNINKKYEGGNTALHDAAEYNQFQEMKALIAAGANVNMKNGKGNTALHLSAKNGKLHSVKALIAAGARLNVKNESGSTALHLSTTFGCLNTLKALIDAGANIHIKKNDGETALHYSIRNGHTDIVKALIAAGAKINEEDGGGSTPLHLASERGHLNIVNALVAAGANINKRNMFIATPLHLASKKGCLDVVKALILAGADVSLHHVIRTPLELAYKEGRRGVWEFIIKYIVLMNYRKGESIFCPYWELDSYKYECEEKIKIMRDMQLGNSSVSVFEFLTETDENKVALYSSEDYFGITNECDRTRYRDDLAMYADDFEVQFRKGNERFVSLHQCQEFMTICFPKVLPLEICRMISEYLTNDDLKNFIYSMKFKRKRKSTLPLEFNSLKRKFKAI